MVHGMETTYSLRSGEQRLHGTVILVKTVIFSGSIPIQEVASTFFEWRLQQWLLDNFNRFLNAIRKDRTKKSWEFWVVRRKKLLASQSIYLWDRFSEKKIILDRRNLEYMPWMMKFFI